MTDEDGVAYFSESIQSVQGITLEVLKLVLLKWNSTQ